jgi:hypothetical protein
MEGPEDEWLAADDLAADYFSAYVAAKTKGYHEQVRQCLLNVDACRARIGGGLPGDWEKEAAYWQAELDALNVKGPRSAAAAASGGANKRAAAPTDAPEAAPRGRGGPRGPRGERADAGKSGQRCEFPPNVKKLRLGPEVVRMHLGAKGVKGYVLTIAGKEYVSTSAIMPRDVYEREFCHGSAPVAASAADTAAEEDQDEETEDDWWKAA